MRLELMSVRENIAVVEDSVSPETAALAIEFLKRVEGPGWSRTRLSRGGRFKKNRLGYGRPDQPPVPPILKRLGNEAFENALKKLPDFPNWNLFSVDTVVVNRYAPGEGVGYHKDPPRKNAFVVGVTLYDDPSSPHSLMRFLEDEGGAIHDVPTPHRSSYVFTGPAYHAAKHCRWKTKKQRGTVWSITLRAARVV